MKRIVIIAMIIGMFLMTSCGNIIMSQEEIHNRIEAAKTQGYQQAEKDLGFSIKEAKTKLNEANVLRNPTYAELMEWLKEDKTNERKFQKYDYGTFDFAAALNKNAQKKGFRGGITFLFFGEGTIDAINFFETSDKERVYIDPQIDRKVTVKVDESYRGQNQFTKSDFDDTIRRIVDSW